MYPLVLAPKSLQQLFLGFGGGGSFAMMMSLTVLAWHTNSHQSVSWGTGLVAPHSLLPRTLYLLVGPCGTRNTDTQDYFLRTSGVTTTNLTEPSTCTQVRSGKISHLWALPGGVWAPGPLVSDHR